MSVGPHYEQAAWGCIAREDASGRLRHGNVLHFISKYGETPCGKSFEPADGMFVHDHDAPPGTPRCKTCEKKWATW